MRKKLIALAFALTAAAAALGVFSPKPAEAACFLVCCPGTSICQSCCTNQPCAMLDC